MFTVRVWKKSRRKEFANLSKAEWVRYGTGFMNLRESSTGFTEEAVMETILDRMGKRFVRTGPMTIAELRSLHELGSDWYVTQ